MCRTGGRRCPSSRTPSKGGTRGQRPAAGRTGDTTPPGSGTGHASTTPPPPPPGRTGSDGAPPTVVFNNGPGTTVGFQASDVTISGSITITDTGITIGGPVTTTPESAAGQAAVARAAEAAREAARAARKAARTQARNVVTGPASAIQLGPRNTASGHDVIGIQAGHVLGSIRTSRPASTPADPDGDTPRPAR